MALSRCSGSVNVRSHREPFMFIDWSNLLSKIEHETANTKFQHILAGMYELALELIEMETKQKDMKTQLEKSYQNELLQKTKTIEALGSTIVKLAETRDLDVYIPEAYRILSCDTELLTPPLDSEIFPPKPCTVSRPLSSQHTLNENGEIKMKRDKPKNEKLPLNKLLHIDLNDPKNHEGRKMINMNHHSQNNKEILKKQSKNDQEKVIYIESNSSLQTSNNNDEMQIKRDKSKNDKETPLNKLIHNNQNYPKCDNDRNVVNVNHNSQDRNETLRKQSKNDQDIYMENNFNMKTEQRSQNLSQQNPDQAEEDTSGDVSITDDSMWEINGTPTGRASPILGMNIMRNRKVPSSQKKFEVSGLPKSKRKLSLSRNAKSTQAKIPRYLKKPKKTVDLGRLSFSTSISDPKLNAMKMSTEDEDVILPSPTSESMRNTFSAKVRISEASTSPPRSATPPAPSQDETNMTLGIAVVEFDKPMETDILNASMDLLHGIAKLEPTSPILCESRNKSNTPVKQGPDTNVSVSVLRQPFRGRSERENVAPVSNKEPASRTRKLPEESPDKSSAECCITQFDAEETVALLRQYNGDDDVKKFIEKKSERVPAQPGHAYKEEPVRKKADKMKLPGWVCDECKYYINAFYRDDPVMLDNIIEKCSKHRGKFNPARPKTPPGYWDPHLSVPEDTEALNRLNNVA